MKRGYRSGNHIIRYVSITLAVLCVLAGITLAVLLPHISINEHNIKVLRIPFTEHYIPLENAPFHDPSQVEAPPDTEEVVRPAEGTTYQERIERAVTLPYHMMFDPAAVDSFLSALRGTDVNTVIIEVKAPSGALAFVSQVEHAMSAESNDPLMNLKAKLNGAGYAVVASFSCFRDNALPRANDSTGCKTADNALWEDSMRYTWLNPYSEDAQVYLISLLGEVYTLGFHELLLTNLSFPHDAGAERVVFDSAAEPQARIEEFLFRLGGFHDERPDLSLSARFDAANGQSMQAFANTFYRIYLPIQNDEVTEAVIDTAPIIEFSALLGEGTLPYRLVPLFPLSERTANESFAMKTEAQTFGVGYCFESPDGVYDPILFQTKKES